LAAKLETLNGPISFEFPGISSDRTQHRPHRTALRQHCGATSGRTQQRWLRQSGLSIFLRQIYVEDSAVEDLAELEGDSPFEAGYLEKKAIEADNIEKVVQIAHDWAAALSSDVPDWVTVIVEEIGTSQHCSAGMENETGHARFHR
jgi:hypothetical protein